MRIAVATSSLHGVCTRRVASRFVENTAAPGSDYLASIMTPNNPLGEFSTLQRRRCNGLAHGPQYIPIVSTQPSLLPLLSRTSKSHHYWFAHKSEFARLHQPNIKLRVCVYVLQCEAFLNLHKAPNTQPEERENVGLASGISHQNHFSTSISIVASHCSHDKALNQLYSKKQ